MTWRAFITGVTGRAGHRPSQFLQGKGYWAYGSRHRASSFSTRRIDHIRGDLRGLDGRIHPHCGDLAESSNCIRIASWEKPYEIYSPILGNEDLGGGARINQKQTIRERVVYDFAGATLEASLAGDGYALSTASGA